MNAVESIPDMTEGTILIVEDEPALAEILDFNLRREGFRPLLAADGLSACRLAGAERPDLILLDLMLPDLSGWEICRLIRGQQDPWLASTPILMLTALGTQTDRLKGLELGADAYLSKPYSIQEVVLRCRRLLAQRRERAAIGRDLEALRAAAELQTGLQEMLVHELRNQLVVIGGFSRLLAKTPETPPNGAYLQAIHRSSESLRWLAEGFLLVRRIEGGGFELPREETDLAALLAETAGLWQALAAEREIALQSEFDAAPPLLLHGGAIRLIASCLLENAIKYSGRGATVTLRLAATADAVLLIVADHGPGIPAAEQDRIFERFYRGAGAEQAATGSGLGLYIARTLTEALAGEVSVFSAVGQGSRFTVRFPAVPAAARGAGGRP